MLVAVFILFIGIVGLVLYLVVQSYSRARSEQYDASSLVEEYANNRMITQQGDVVFCYRLLLPPAYSYTAEAYDQIVEIWRVALKDLPRGTIIMRSDRYDRSYFDASCMPETSYIQREEKAYARSRLKTAERRICSSFIRVSGRHAIPNRRTLLSPFRIRSSGKRMAPILIS